LCAGWPGTSGFPGRTGGAVCVLDGLVETTAYDAERLDSDPHSFLLEELHELGEAHVLVPDQVRLWDAHPIVAYLGGLGGVPAHLVDL
jgi:hypothetical protein